MPSNYKIFDLDNNLTQTNCKIVVSDKYSDNVVSEISDEANYIYINSLYALYAKEELKGKFINFIRNYRRSQITILSTSLIDEEILEAIANNSRITSVTLGCPSDVYVLNREAFDILDKSESIYFIDTDSVEGEYTKKEKERLSFYSTKKLVDVFTYDMLNSSYPLHFIRPLNAKEIENLNNYSKKGIKIYFEYNDVNNIIAVIKSLKGKQAEFIFRDNRIIKENTEQFKPYFDENIAISQNVSIRRYLEVENILDLAVKDIKESSLSPYEKYLAVFKIVKDFKPYRSEGREYQSNTPASYDLYEILFSEFIICRGFSELMIDLLKRVGISATFLHIELYKEQETLSIEDYATLTKEEQDIKKGSKDYHSRVIFRLIDSKYNIDGIFISDVTWDQEENLDLFNHSSLTPYETRFETDRFYNTPDDIFDIQSGTEFYTKLQKFPKSVSRFLEIIMVIDKPFYKYLENKYDIDGPYTTEFFIEIYNYIITHTNKRISKDVLLNALKEVIRHTYTNLSDEELNKIMNNLSKSYDEGQTISFLPNDNIKR